METTHMEVWSDRVIRITQSTDAKSLSVIAQPFKGDWKIQETGDAMLVETKALRVRLDRKTGAVTFRDLDDQLILDAPAPGQFARAADERIYGLGQHQAGHWNYRDTTVQLHQKNCEVAVPVMMSSKGYGILWDNPALTEVKVGKTDVVWKSEAGSVDYYFMYGPRPDDVIHSYRQLTGHVPLLPLWAYGYWQSRERYKTQDELLEVVAKYRALGVPLDCIVQDWQYWGAAPHWNAMQFEKSIFPDPKGMVDEVHRQHAKIMIVAWPGFGPETAQYKEFEKKKMLLNFRTWPPETFAKPYDVYDPEARAIYWSYLNKGVFSLGVDGLWLDSTEPDHIDDKKADYDIPTHLGTYRSVHNAFPLMHTRGVHDHWRETNPSKRVVLLTRSSFTGQQRCGSVTWSGDILASWDVLAKQIPAAFNFAMTGNPNWNADIGGFFTGKFKGPKDPAYQELYLRWIQFACFTPLMRSHGTGFPREIYQFGQRGEKVFDTIEKTIRLRYALLPYIYATAWDVTHNDGTFMRPLVMDYPAEQNLQEIADEYLFGRNLLVAPVLTAGATVRHVVLPPGTWYDFWTNERVEGGKTVNRPVSAELIPVYVKAGAVLPIGPDVQYATEKPWDCLTLKVYPGADGTFTLYEDEGDNYNYEKGAYATIPLTWNDATRTLTIGARTGEFPRMLRERTFRVFGKDVKYRGEEVRVK